MLSYLYYIKRYKITRNDLFDHCNLWKRTEPLFYKLIIFSNKNSLFPSQGTPAARPIHVLKKPKRDNNTMNGDLATQIEITGYKRKISSSKEKSNVNKLCKWHPMKRKCKKQER